MRKWQDNWIFFPPSIHLCLADNTHARFLVLSCERAPSRVPCDGSAETLFPSLCPGRRGCSLHWHCNRKTSIRFTMEWKHCQGQTPSGFEILFCLLEYLPGCHSAWNPYHVSFRLSPSGQNSSFIVLWYVMCFPLSVINDQTPWEGRHSGQYWH